MKVEYLKQGLFMTPQSLLPDNWVLLSALVFWLPGEVIGQKIWKIEMPRFGSRWPLLLITPVLILIFSFVQVNSGMLHEARLLFKLGILCFFGIVTYVFASGERLFSRVDQSKATGLEVYSCCLFAYFVCFLSLIWWLPPGVKSIWMWALQFEPRLITFMVLVAASGVSILAISRCLTRLVRLSLATLGCMLWQLGGVLGKSLSVQEIAESEKISGYLSASRLFTNTAEIAGSFTERIGTLPFHVNTHPAGKVFLMHILDSFNQAHTSKIWAIVIILAVSLIVPISFKISRLMNGSENESITAACFVGLIPSLALFSPGFDAYNMFLCALLLLTWIKALKCSSKRISSLWAIVTGILGYSAVTVSYTSLVFGAVLLCWAPVVLSRHQSTLTYGEMARRLIVLAICAGSALVGIDFLFSSFTGYSNMMSLVRSIEIQSTIEASNRSGLNAFLLNIFDYGYGMGPAVLAVALLLFFRGGAEIIKRKLVSDSRQGHHNRAELSLTSDSSLVITSISAVILVGLSGFLDIETARVWLMLMPPSIIAVTVWVMKGASHGYLGYFFFCQVCWGLVQNLRYQFLF